MPRRATSAPKHRATPSPAPALAKPPAGKHRAARAELGLGRQLKKGLVTSGVAAAATGLAVSAGVAGTDDTPDTAAAAALATALQSPTDSASESVLEEMEAERSDVGVSRSDRRTSVDQAKLDLLTQEAESGGQVTRSEDLGGGDPRTIARALMPEFGFSADQFGCLDSLWTRESGWNVYADNPTSSAYGIPQALPGSKMASAGSDWATNPVTQIRWGLGYIQDRYGSPCGAWAHSESHGWY